MMNKFDPIIKELMANGFRSPVDFASSTPRQLHNLSTKCILAVRDVANTMLIHQVDSSMALAILERCNEELEWRKTNEPSL